MAADGHGTGPDPASPPPAPAGTLYGRGGAPLQEGKGDLFARLHPAVTAAVAVAVIAVLVLGYLVWRASTDEETPAAGGSPTAPAAAPPRTTSPAEPSSPSPSPSPTAERLTTGTWSLESVDNAGWYVRRQDGAAVIGAVTDAQVRREATLVVVAGLADPSCFTFSTADGRYLRHFDFRLRFDQPDDSDLFRKDATFCVEPGAVDGSVRLRSHNYPDRFIHHRDAELRLDPFDGSDAYAFTVRSPLAP